MADEPVIVSRGESAARASQPDGPFEDGRWHIYESNPAPWWVGVIWLSFFVFGVVYLIGSLLG